MRSELLTRVRGFAGASAGATIVLLTALVVGGHAQSKAPAKAATTTKTATTAKPSSTAYNDVYNGWKWWHVYCYRCHGVNAIGGANAPNLIGQNQKFTRPEFLKIVRDGRPDKGMQSWKELLNDKQINQIQLYVRARKEKILPAGRPNEVGPNKGEWVPPAGWPPK